MFTIASIPLGMYTSTIQIIEDSDDAIYYLFSFNESPKNFRSSSKCVNVGRITEDPRVHVLRVPHYLSSQLPAKTSPLPYITFSLFLFLKRRSRSAGSRINERSVAEVGTPDYKGRLATISVVNNSGFAQRVPRSPL